MKENKSKITISSADEETPAISIIVPVYNTEELLARCLDSILFQTFQDFELICVNDGSSDGSQKILDDYAARDKRIKLIEQKNAGQSAARNAAMKIARGKWLGFVDSDDTIDSNFYEKLLAAADKTGADIVMGVLRYYKKHGKQREKRAVKGEQTNLASKIRRLTNGSCCNKLFKSSIIMDHQIQFPVGKIMEDNAFLIKAVYYAGKMAFIDDAFYNYFYNPGSTCYSNAPEIEQKRARDRFALCEELLAFVKSNDFDKAATGEFYEFCIRSILSRSVFRKRKHTKRLVQIFGLGFVVYYRLVNNKVLRFFYHDAIGDDGTGVVRIFKIPIYRYQPK